MMVLVLLGWYFLKHSLARQRQTPYSRGVSKVLRVIARSSNTNSEFQLRYMTISFTSWQFSILRFGQGLGHARLSGQKDSSTVSDGV